MSDTNLIQELTMNWKVSPSSTEVQNNKLQCSCIEMHISLCL